MRNLAIAILLIVLAGCTPKAEIEKKVSNDQAQFFVDNRIRVEFSTVPGSTEILMTYHEYVTAEKTDKTPESDQTKRKQEEVVRNVANPTLHECKIELIVHFDNQQQETIKRYWANWVINETKKVPVKGDATVERVDIVGEFQVDSKQVPGSFRVSFTKKPKK